MQQTVEEIPARLSQWGSMNLGLFYNMHVYKTLIATVLSFVMQLAEELSDLDT